MCPMRRQASTPVDPKSTSCAIWQYCHITTTASQQSSWCSNRDTGVVAVEKQSSFVLASNLLCFYGYILYYAPPHSILSLRYFKINKFFKKEAFVMSTCHAEDETPTHSHDLITSTIYKEKSNPVMTALVIRLAASKLSANSERMLRNAKMPSRTGSLPHGVGVAAVSNTLEDVSHLCTNHTGECSQCMGLSSIRTLFPFQNHKL